MAASVSSSHLYSVSQRPRWARTYDDIKSSPGVMRGSKRRRATGGCTSFTKEMFPSDWARFLIPWLLIAGFMAVFAWVRGFGWLIKLVTGTAELNATIMSEWTFVTNWCLCVWCLFMAHYSSPGFAPLGLTARSVALELLNGEIADPPPGDSHATQFHWELKRHGKNMGTLRTCKRSIPLLLTPLGTHAMASLDLCLVKPDRAHYCPFTGQAVLEMDHYCPWLGNCIGFGTRKPFLLTLWYALGTGFSLIGACSWDVVLAFASPQRFLASLPLIIAMLTGTIVMVLLGLFLRYHGRLAISNYTTIEEHEKKQAPRTVGLEEQYLSRNPVLELEQWEDSGKATPDPVRWLLLQRYVPVVKRRVRPEDVFVATWMAAAYTPSPWDHGVFANMDHYLGPWYLTGMPLYWGMPQWLPWSQSIRPVQDIASETLSKPSEKPLPDAPPAKAGPLILQGPQEPVGVTSDALRSRRALLHASKVYNDLLGFA